MYCPHTIVFNSRLLMIIRHERSDYNFGAPWGEVLNPLRYELSFMPGPNHFDINDGGWMARSWSDLNWHLWKKRLPRNRS